MTTIPITPDARTAPSPHIPMSITMRARLAWWAVLATVARAARRAARTNLGAFRWSARHAGRLAGRLSGPAAVTSARAALPLASQCPPRRAMLPMARGRAGRTHRVFDLSPYSEASSVGWSPS